MRALLDITPPLGSRIYACVGLIAQKFSLVRSPGDDFYSRIGIETVYEISRLALVARHYALLALPAGGAPAEEARGEEA